MVTVLRPNDDGPAVTTPAPMHVLRTIRQLAQPCTLTTREVASLGDVWYDAFMFSTRRGASAERAEKHAWAIIEAELVAYFDGCPVVPALGVVE